MLLDYGRFCRKNGGLFGHGRLLVVPIEILIKRVKSVITPVYTVGVETGDYFENKEVS